MFRPCLQNKTTLCRDSEGTYLPPDKISQVVISRPLREVIPSIDQVREQQANGRAAFLSVGSLAIVKLNMPPLAAYKHMVPIPFGTYMNLARLNQMAF